MESSCTQSWQAAVDSCVSYGGNIASIVSRQILDNLQTVFGSQVPVVQRIFRFTFYITGDTTYVDWPQ